MGLIRLVTIAVLIYVGFKILQGFLKSRPKSPEPLPKGEDTYRDPVCGTYVAKDDAVIGRVEEERVYFCSMECLEKYREQLDQKEKEAIRQ